MEISTLKQLNSDIAQDRGHWVAVTARQLWERWKRIARKIGDFQARALMTLFYFLILGPTGHSAPLAQLIRWRLSRELRGAGASREGREGVPMEQARRQS